MKNKIPRKIKKEICKVECITRRPVYGVEYFITRFGVRLKSGAKVNRWTLKMINKIIAEQNRIIKTTQFNILENMKAEIDYSNFQRRM